MSTKLDYSKLHNIEVAGIDHRDAPDFCDAYIAYAYTTEFDRALTDAELDALNEDGAFVYEQVIATIY